MVTKIDNPGFGNAFEIGSGRTTGANAEALAHFEGQIGRSKSKEMLSPEDKKKSQSLQENIRSLLSNPRENLLKINSIVRDSSQRLLLPPDMLREIFGTLRRIHREETEKSLDRGDTSAIKGYVSEQLNQVSNGYNELFKNLQGHIETLDPLSQEAESIIILQDEVGEAERSVQKLLKNINSIGQMPGPLQQDMSPSSSRNSDDGSIRIN